MKTFLITTLSAIALTTAASALTVDFEFNGQTSFNPGAPGGGAYGGSIQYSTDAATFVSGGLHTGVFSDIDFDVNSAMIVSSGSPTQNQLTQVELGTGNDAFLSKQTAGFGGTGTAGLDVMSVELEVRFADGIQMFDSIGDLFGEFEDGDIFDIDDVGYISLVVRYAGAASSSPTILRLNTFDAFDITVTGDPVVSTVPLPAGLPLLLAGLGSFGLVRRMR